mgnify:CR=1 FL=1
MKHSIEIDSTLPLIDNLNNIESQLRELDILKQSDSLIAITDNPLDPTSVTIGEGITISALDNKNSSEILSVLNEDANITVANSKSDGE